MTETVSYKAISKHKSITEQMTGSAKHNEEVKIIINNNLFFIQLVINMKDLHP